MNTLIAIARPVTWCGVYMETRNLDDLRQRLVEVNGAAQQIETRARAENRPLTAGEGRDIKLAALEFERISALLEDTEAKVTDSAAMVSDMDHWISQSRGRIAPGHRAQDTSRYAGDGFADDHQHSRDTRAPGIFAAERDGHGFTNFGEFLNSLSLGREDRRLRAAPRDSMEIGTGTGGGYLVPPAFMSEILGGAIVSSELLKRCATIPMMANSMAIAGFNSNASRSAGGVAGLTLQWVGEGATLTAATGTVRAINLTCGKGAIFAHISNELLADTPDGTRQLIEVFQAAASFGLEQAVISGNGVGRPLGILSDPSLVVVAKETSQAADTLFVENLYKMYSRLHPALLSKAVWLANPDAMPQILQLNSRTMNVAGTEVVAGGMPLFVSPGSIANSPMGQILGLPLVLTEACSTVGDLGDVLLVAPSQYALGVRQMASIEMSSHLRFDSDQSTFRLIVRVAGMGKWDAPLTPLHGSTLSWAVALQAR